MTATPEIRNENETQIQLTGRILSLQREAFRRTPYPDLAERRDNLKRLREALIRHQQDLCDAIDQDFGGRSRDETLIAEIMPSIQGIHYTLRNLAKWMKPSRRRVSILFQPASNRVEYQPKGVAGIIVPWNYPVFLAVGPLVAALAAGNRVMIKMSEMTPRTSALFASIIESLFPQDLVAVINGDAEVAADFSSRSFDHLLFTGSTAVGRQVMRAASQHLTPVTLELGGKSPAVISADVPMQDAASRIAFGKVLNAGQTCVAPDYVLCPEDRVEAFVDSFREAVTRMYPGMRDNPDYTGIINERQYQRLQGLLEDARQKGATLIEINPAGEAFDAGCRKIPLTLVLNPSDDMTLLQEEIFGPVLPVVSCQNLDAAIHHINQRPRPLALYYFGYNRDEQQKIIRNTRSGGLCVNDALMHVAQDDLPFGGIGDSGMGHYHGREGFQTFSHARAIYSKQRLNTGRLIYPPHGSLFHKLVYRLFIR